MTRQSLSLFDSKLVMPAIVDSFRKLSPRVQLRNPVMFVVYIGSILTTALFVQALRGQGEAPTGFILAIAAWLWFTVLFANFAEALAEGRSQAQAASLRDLKQAVSAKKLALPKFGKDWIATPAPQLKKGRPLFGRNGRCDRRRRRSGRRNRLGRRKCDHRRVGAGSARGGR